MNRLAVFDCDGTLVDSQHNIVRAMNACFAAAGREPPPAEQTRRIVGLSLVEAMEVLLPGEATHVHEELAERYKNSFLELRGRGLVAEPLYEGIAELLDALESGGWLLGIATGKSDRGLGLCLECHGLSARFVTRQTADRHPSKPHPSMLLTAMAEAGAVSHTSALIGDTSFDMAMARAAGVKAIGVAWGYHNKRDLWEAGAHHVAHHPREVLEWMTKNA